MATTHNLLLLPGDGIGVETMAEVERVIAFFNKKSNKAKFETDSDLVGGSAYDKHGVSITDEAMAKARRPTRSLFGAVGGPKWDNVPYAAPPRGRPAAPAQGPRPVRQPAPRHLLSGARRCDRA